MNFVASVKLKSELDSNLKSTHCHSFILYDNEFILIDDIYVCKSISNLIPLLDDPDIEIIVSQLNLIDS